MKSFLKMNVESKVHYTLGGQLINNEPWKHIKRSIDTYEVIIGVKETLFLKVNDTAYQVNPGDILIIPAHALHEGYAKSNPGISFFWFHFYASSEVTLIDEEMLSNEIQALRTDPHPYLNKTKTFIYLPTYYTPKDINRIIILCRQLLDVANAKFHNKFATDYLATYLLIEISEEALKNVTPSSPITPDQQLEVIMEWIRLNATNNDITVQGIAEKFNYNPNYLSRLFKNKTGKNIKDYIKLHKLSCAKDLLTRSNLGVKQIAHAVGIEDEKYFMRLFKKHEKVTPTEYRKAYYRISLNLD